MAFEILFDSTLPSGFFVPKEWADLDGDSPVVDFGGRMAKFRVTVVLKSGTGDWTFGLDVADDLAFSQQVRTVGQHVLALPAQPYLCVVLYAFRGPVRYARITATGTGAVVYDARLEWMNAPIQAMGGGAPAAAILTALVPDTVALGEPDFTLSVEGTGFTPASEILWNGSPEPTTFVSETEVTTGVNMATAGVAIEIPVAVKTGEAVSNVLPFMITET